MADSITCPHCHGELSLVPKGATPSPSQGVTQGDHARSQEWLVDSAKTFCTERLCMGLWTAAWAAAVRRHLDSFLASGAILDRSGVASWRASLVESGLGAKTVNSYLSSLSSFCQWLVNRGDLPSNPCTGQKVSRRGQSATGAQEERLAFAAEEVRVILDYVDTHAPTPGHRGFVYAMAYTGARNEEAGQLRFRDVQVIDGIQVFDFSSEDRGQRHKTRASKRKVPVHPVLTMGATSPLRACIPVASVPFDGGERNLWGFRLGGESRNLRYSVIASKWMNRVVIKTLKKQGKIRDDSRLSLYSLRHAVTTQLKHKGVPEDLLSELVGHTNSSMTTGRYGKLYPVVKLDEVVRMIEW